MAHSFKFKPSKVKFIKEHRQYEIFSPYLLDRPKQEWTIFQSNNYKFTIKKKNKNNKTKKSKIL